MRMCLIVLCCCAFVSRAEAQAGEPSAFSWNTMGSSRVAGEPASELGVLRRATVCMSWVDCASTSKKSDMAYLISGINLIGVLFLDLEPFLSSLGIKDASSWDRVRSIGVRSIVVGSVGLLTSGVAIGWTMYAGRGSVTEIWRHSMNMPLVLIQLSAVALQGYMLWKGFQLLRLGQLRWRKTLVQVVPIVSERQVGLAWLGRF